jgi:Ulp1 family protease
LVKVYDIVLKDLIIVPVHENVTGVWFLVILKRVLVKIELMVALKCMMGIDLVLMSSY